MESCSLLSRKAVYACILLLAGTVSIEAISVRTGGGYRGGGYSGYSSYSGYFSSYSGYFSSYSGYFSSYSSSAAFRYGSYSSAWRTTTQGATAYLILTQLALQPTSYRTQYTNIANGKNCQNYEDFNGTMIGDFKCPVDGFKATDLYCCGPDGYQYCCNDSGNRPDYIVIVVSVVGTLIPAILILAVSCSFRTIKRRKRIAFMQQQALIRKQNELQPPPPAPEFDFSKVLPTQHAVHSENYSMAPPPPVYPSSDFGTPSSAVMPPSHFSYSSQFAANPSPHDPALQPPPPYESIETSK